MKNKKLTPLQMYESLVYRIEELERESISRFKNIENAITQHSIGVQNVYNEFIKIKDKFSSLSINKKFVALLNLKEEIDSILNTYRSDEVQDAMKCVRAAVSN